MPLTPEQQQCRAQILSEDYLDLIYTVRLTANEIFSDYGPFCRETINYNYSIAHLDRRRVPDYSIPTYGYDAIPDLYSLLDTSALEAADITPLLLSPGPDLRGQGVLIGFLDTGIDYRNALFRHTDGSTRIAALWDQTIQSDRPPADFPYGTEYTEEELNTALRSADPYELVPSLDENGHGTFLAGVAAGGESADGRFSGAAPEATLAVVKCKTAKENLKRYYFNNQSDVYQTTDLMTGLSYLLSTAARLQLPLVICFGMGSNGGAHDGTTVLETLLSQLTSQSGIVPVLAAGNEGNRAHHYYGVLGPEDSMEEVSLRIPEGTAGFRAELWGEPSEIYSVAFLSPSGELFPRIPARLGQSQVLTSPLTSTRLFVDYTLTVSVSGNLLISLGFENPTPGLWTIQVFHDTPSSGFFHIWLPITAPTEPDPVFLRPDPDITLTSPGNARSGLVVSAWDHRSDSLYVYSSRGYTRDRRVRPDLAAPGVAVEGPAPDGRLIARSGSSVAAAIAAGAAADLLTWGVTNRNDISLDAQAVRAYLIRGAGKKDVYSYPNREWGYGTLDLLGAFETLVHK